MDMHISGSGKIPAGEYDSIRISGSGSLHGLVRCNSMAISGSAHGETLCCNESIRISGSAHFSQDVTTANLVVSGSAHTQGSITASGEVKLAGGLHCEKNLKAATLIVAGGLNVDGDIEAETARMHGGICCPGLLNAEEIEIETDGHTKIGSIGGSRIVITKKDGKNGKKRLSLFSKISGKRHVTIIEQAIEGDDIAIESVTCPRVSGRVVAVGEDCEIALLQYGERYEIHEKAKVGRIERI